MDGPTAEGPGARMPAAAPPSPGSAPLLHLDAAQVARALPWPALVQALHDAFVQGCEVPPRHPHAIGGAGTVLLMPAWRAGGCLGVKTVTIFPGNGALSLPGVHAVYTLFDAGTGVPLAVLEGSELTARRTAAASALAARFLAREDATQLLLVGAGRVAALLAGAMRSVRPGLSRVAVWNRSPAAAHKLAQALRGEGFDASAAEDLQAAARQADIVSCATLSTAALLQGEWLQPGTHLDLIGSFTPAMREADGRCFARGRVFVDTEEALAKSGDVLQAVAEGHFEAAAVQGTLATLCRGHAAGRRSAAEITLFKSVGTALEDLAAAELVLATVNNPSP
jgi:ornithine cyclodeaminase